MRHPFVIVLAERVVVVAGLARLLAMDVRIVFRWRLSLAPSGAGLSPIPAGNDTAVRRTIGVRPCSTIIWP